VDPRGLPKVGVISNTKLDFYSECSNLSGKRLLCIGFSEAEVVDYVERHGPASITLLTNWVGHVDARPSRFPLVIGDLTQGTKFDDDAFDAILTLSVLEHLNPLRAAFREMLRIVRPGGEMLHNFGAAWSCAYGHHLYAKPGDRLLDFTSWSMPAHMHLLCSREEITGYYAAEGYPEGAAASVLHWFYDTPLINREPYDEYVTIMSEDCFQMDWMQLMYNELPADHVARLRARYPAYRDFSTYGGKYRLIVRK
jgi:SAM-dependent methyltransferase